MSQNKLTVEVQLHRIGKCPVCGKGQMLKGSAGWTCDYFKNLQDKCIFTIFETYSGYTLCEEDAVALIKDGRTMKHTFYTSDGKPFVARLILEKNKVKLQSENRILKVRCPNCGGRVIETQKGYACENFFQEESHCPLYIPRAFCERMITEEEVCTVLEKGHTEILDGFRAQGRTFSAYMVIKADGTCKLDSAVCKCPKCGGQIYTGIKAYTCGNYSNPDIKCNFMIWRNVSGHEVTIDEAKILCREKATPVVTFKTVDGVEYAGRIVLDSQWKIKKG